jgi:hypothetical protein
VQRLQGLADVLYAGPPGVPRCLLRALLQHQARCRLHVFTFALDSLHLPQTDPNELTLVTAPCLHSIWRRWLLERDVRHDARDVIHAREIRGELRRRLMEGNASNEQDDEYMAVFRRVLPKRAGGAAKWYDDWQSWPLAETTS